MIAVASTAAIAGVVTWALWPEPPRQREYLDATACLLTDDKGVTSEAAQPVWSAMQQASVTALVRVQTLQVRGPQTTGNAASYLASLADGRCGAVITVGEAPVNAAVLIARSHPNVSFITVGGGTPAANIDVIDSATGDLLTTRLGERINALADAAS